MALTATTTPTGIPTTATGPAHPVRGLMDEDTDRWAPKTPRLMPRVIKSKGKFPNIPILSFLFFLVDFHIEYVI